MLYQLIKTRAEGQSSYLYFSNIVKFAEKIEVEVYANQEKSVSAIATLIKYVFSFEFSSWIINEFDKVKLHVLYQSWTVLCRGEIALV